MESSALALVQLPLTVVVLILFVLGEMLWIPTSQALAARIAREELRGASNGAFGAGGTVAWPIAPLIALQLREAGGEASIRLFFAAVSNAGTLAGAAACSAQEGR